MLQKRKALLTTNEKYYSVDLGLRNHIKSSEQIDYSKLFEKCYLFRNGIERI